MKDGIEGNWDVVESGVCDVASGGICVYGCVVGACSYVGAFTSYCG